MIFIKLLFMWRLFIFFRNYMNRLAHQRAQKSKKMIEKPIASISKPIEVVVPKNSLKAEGKNDRKDSFHKKKDKRHLLKNAFMFKELLDSPLSLRKKMN